MRELTFMEAIREALREELKRDEKVYLLGEDIGKFGGCFGVTKGLWEEFGSERVMDTPISEAAIVGTSVGAAIMGWRPVPEVMFADFLTVCFDQLYNQAPKLKYMSNGEMKIPLTIRTACGAGIRAGAQHSQSPEALCVHCPGLKVVYPGTAYDAYGLLKAAIRDDDPVIVFEHKLLYFISGKEQLPDDEFTIPLGKANVKREGKDVTVVAYGLMLSRALGAAEKLQGDGISVEVVDPRTLSPLDKETIINSLKKTHRAVIVHEAPKTGGYGGELAAILAEEAFDYLDAPIGRVAAPDTPIPFSPPMEDFYLPNEERIVQGVRKVLGT
ncbi:MAG: alpha-ketoacid dehydrogenase subunit beta [Chloroflexota bacterium]